MRMELHDKGLVLSAPEIPDEPSEAVQRASGGPIFSALPEKMGEKRGAGLRFGACCGCGSGKYLFYCRYEHMDSPYGRYGTRRLLRYNGFANNCV